MATDLVTELIKNEISRRQFIKAAGISACFYVVGMPVLDEARLTVSNFINDIKNELDDHIYNHDLIFSLLGNLGRNTSLIPGTAHYCFPHNMHPDDKAAAAAVEKAASLNINDIKIVNGLIDLSNLNGTIVALGSPISNNLSRAILSYDYITENPADGMRKNERTSLFDLRFDYLTDSNRLKLLGESATRLLKGEEHVVKNWSILDNKYYKPYIPTITDKNKLRNDYLLITVLPNILSKEAYDNGDKVIIIGGTHGVGTRAIHLLFKDTELLTTIKNKTETSPYWQALLTIDQVAQNTTQGRATPFSLSKKVLCAPVEFDERKVTRRFAI